MIMKNTLYESIKGINDIDILNEMRNKFNAACEKREKELTVIAEAEKLNDSSFFTIKESFANLCPTLIKTKKGISLIKKFVNEHKSNKELQKMYGIYENISSVDNSINIDNFINEMKTIVGEIDFKTLNEGISNLRTILKEGYIEVGETAKNAISEPNKGMLEESVNYVFGNKKSLDNISRYALCMNEIKKYISENKIKGLSFKKNIDIDKILENFNTEFSIETLGEENFTLIKEINESTDKKSLFERYKDECITKIDEAVKKDINQSNCNQLVEFKTRILKKEYNPDTLGLDIANFIELGNTVSE